MLLTFHSISYQNQREDEGNWKVGFKAAEVEKIVQPSSLEIFQTPRNFLKDLP